MLVELYDLRVMHQKGILSFFDHLVPYIKQLKKPRPLISLSCVRFTNRLCKQRRNQYPSTGSIVEVKPNVALCSGTFLQKTLIKTIDHILKLFTFKLKKK